MTEIIKLGNKNPCGHGSGGGLFDPRGISPTVCCGDKTYIYIVVREESKSEHTDNLQCNEGGVVTDLCNCLDANYFKGVGSNQERTGVIATDNMNIPILIDKGRGVGSSSNLGILAINNEIASCLCARDYKGISRRGANAVVKIDGFNMDSDQVSARAIKAQYFKNSASNFCRNGSYGATAVIEKGDENIENNNIRIRKLTPRECWRLQAFPDDFFEKAAAVVSNTQLYKQAGNAVTVSVAKAIGDRLREIELEELAEANAGEELKEVAETLEDELNALLTEKENENE